MELLYLPWHWAFSGFMIAFVVFLLIFSGQKFGVSSSFVHICSMTGIGSKIKYFDFDWKGNSWLLLFAVGAIIGGYIASHFMIQEPIQISAATEMSLADMGIAATSLEHSSSGYMPDEIFGNGRMSSIKFIMIFLFSGLMIGFGTRYAGGCTSGHAITGLSNFQLPSLVAVIGFFIGGLTMTHFLLEPILSWIL